jgi:hypothetical protein
MKARLSIFAVLTPLLATNASAQVQEGDDSVDVISALLRRQGYRCDRPLSTKRDAELSKPDQAVWDVKCANATYRVRLVPNMAAHVERIE